MIRAAVICLVAGLPVTAAAETFVSLAVGETPSVYGFGVAEAAADAERLALSACELQGSGCSVGYTRSDTCVAFAADLSSGSWGAHRARTIDEATQNALDHCATTYNNNAPCQFIEARCANTQMETS